jgi:putative transposase
VSSDDDLPERDRWARLRFAIIGPLLAAPPAEGDLRAALVQLAARSYRHPLTGLEVRFGLSTLERWYYACRRAADPLAVLRNQIRRDIGRFPSLSVAAVEALRAEYAAHRSWVLVH